MEHPDVRELLQLASKCDTIDDLRRVIEGFGLWLNDTAIASTFEAIRRRRVASQSGALGDRELAAVVGGVGVTPDDYLSDDDLISMLESLFAAQ